MATEGCIFFMYDTKKWKELGEEDDLMAAISYFFPTSWTSDMKYWLCGPLITAGSQVSRMLGHDPEVIHLGKSIFSLIHFGRYSMVFGGQRQTFSDRCITDVCRCILGIISLFYPSIEYLLGSVESDEVIGGIVETIISKPYIATEFSSTPFFTYSKASKRHLLKCVQVVDFASYQRDVFCCCLFLNGRVVRSNMGHYLTKTVQFCTTCSILRRKMGVRKQGCSVCPIFVTERDYDLMVRRQTTGVDDFRELSNGLRVSPTSTQKRFRETCWKAPPPVSELGNFCYRRGGGTPRNEHKAEPKTRVKKEVAVYYITVDNCCLAMITKVANQESANLSKHILKSCGDDMRKISDGLSDGYSPEDPVGDEDVTCSENTSVSVKHIQQQCIAFARENTDHNLNHTRSTFRNSQHAFVYERCFSKENVILEVKHNKDFNKIENTTCTTTMETRP